MLNTTFTVPTERAKAFGIFGAVGASGTVLGLLVGGTLTQFLDWRWTMFIDVAFAAVVILGGMRLTHSRDKVGSRLDLPGTLMISAGLFALVYGFSNTESRSWGSPLTWGFLAAGVVLIIGFALWQSRARDPLLPLSVLRYRDRAASFTAASATVNVMQQVGGSIGPALLNTLAASAAASHLLGKNATDAAVQGEAALHSYTTAFAWASGLFFAGALITALLYRSKATTAPSLEREHS